MEFLTSQDLPDIFIDGLVTGSNQLLFLSVWGSESRIQQLRAQFSLRPSEGGLIQFSVERPSTGDNYWAMLGDRDRFEHATGRPAQQTLFAHLTQLFVYDRLAIMPDRANRRCLLLSYKMEEEAQFKNRIWQAIQTICPVPLLPSWYQLLPHFIEQEWVKIHPGFNVEACEIDLPQKGVEEFITTQLRSGQLNLL